MMTIPRSETPHDRSDIPRVDGARSGAPARNSEGLHDPEVLIAARDPSARCLLRAAVEWQGCHVQDAAGDIAAIALTRRATPDLVIVDLENGEVGDLELLRLVQQAGGGAMRILAVTDRHAAAIDAARAAGADDALSRPIHPAVLRKRIAMLLADGAVGPPS